MNSSVDSQVNATESHWVNLGSGNGSGYQPTRNTSADVDPNLSHRVAATIND